MPKALTFVTMIENQCLLILVEFFIVFLLELILQLLPLYQLWKW